MKPTRTQQIVLRAVNDTNLRDIVNMIRTFHPEMTDQAIRACVWGMVDIGLVVLTEHKTFVQVEYSND